MAEQNYKNHRRIIPVWHLGGGFLLLAFLTISIVYFINNIKENTVLSILLLIAAILLILISIYCRAFALRAQDRAIRAEENFRHFVLTGKRLDARLRLGQIIALRFASDEEFPALAEKAVAGKLSQKQIKQAVKNWRPDYYRV